MLSSVLLGSQYSFPHSPSFISFKLSPCIAEEVPDAFITFHFSPRYQPSAEPPQLHICQNLSIDTTRSLTNPRSTGMHRKWAYKLNHHRLKQPHGVARLRRATTMISWQLQPTTIPLKSVLRGNWGRIVE